MTRERRFVRVTKRSVHRISGRMTRRVVTLLRARGAELDGLPLDVLENRDARVEVKLVDALVEHAVAALGAKGLSLALAGVFDEDTYDAAGRVMLGEPTLGRAFEAAFAHQRLWGDGERFSLRVEGDVLRIGFEHPGEGPLAKAVLSELAFIELVTSAKMLASSTVKSARFRHAKLSELKDVFGLEPKYRAARNELELSEVPLSVPRELLQQVLAREAKVALQKLPEAKSFVALARAQVHDFPTLAVLAKRLHVSARTLQRRLAEEGTSHFELVDELRRALAKQLQSKGVSEQDIADEVRFSDVRALSRARRRWSRTRQE